MISFLKTKSQGVRRLSLFLGFAAALYRIITLQQPFGPPAQDVEHPLQTLLINLFNIVIEGAIYFIVVWLIIRTIAWIVKGFISDREEKKGETK